MCLEIQEYFRFFQITLVVSELMKNVRVLANSKHTPTVTCEFLLNVKVNILKLKT